MGIIGFAKKLIKSGEIIVTRDPSGRTMMISRSHNMPAWAEQNKLSVKDAIRFIKRQN